MSIIYPILATLVISLVSLVGVFSFLFSENILNKIIFLLISFAAGSLIGVSFLHILPEIIESSGEVNIFYIVVFGFSIFFILEKYFYWRHCHKGEKCELHPVSYLNFIGDGLHNFIDGIFIGSSFSINFQTGIVATLAVILHEVPQEIGDFGILLHSGFSRIKALLFNFLISLTAVIGSICGFLLSQKIEKLPNYILSVVAGGFIYIASCDLIPALHREKNLYKSIVSFFLFLLGVLFMGLVKL
ncbi:MAG: ZIP family metal transporter [Elusimicrobiota bacterium]|nr:ZIP family metal transporter [Endomicrobiia bacterium]MDW8165238.1 ZIP family metal transporter [Elusimicrobiota bacterium]